MVKIAIFIGDRTYKPIELFATRTGVAFRCLRAPARAKPYLATTPIAKGWHSSEGSTDISPRDQQQLTGFNISFSTHKGSPSIRLPDTLGVVPASLRVSPSMLC